MSRLTINKAKSIRKSKALKESDLMAVITYKDKPLKDDDPVFLNILKSAIDIGFNNSKCGKKLDKKYPGHIPLE